MEPVTVGQEESKSKNNGCFIGCLVAGGCLSLIAIIGVIFLSLVIGSCSNAVDSIAASASDDGPRDEFPEFSEVWSLGAGDETDPKIVRIKLNGVIASSAHRGGIFDEVNPYSAQALLDRVHAAEADEDVVGIMLEINSPGGEVTMSDILFDAIMRFRKSDTNRFVYALIGDMAASVG